MIFKNLKQLLFTILVFITSGTSAQIFINEIDSDTPGIDVAEFVEIRTITPFQSLAGHVLVYFNGNPASSNAFQSYMTINLNAYTTDANGILTLGCTGVSPVPDHILSDNLVQNGEDAIAIYQALPAAFPDGTLATTTNLVHAVAYDTGDPDAVTLMSMLGITSLQMDENANGLQATESIQRKNDGTYEVKSPTPGAMNDGSGVQYNELKINVTTANKNEGDTLHITFTSQTNVTSNLSFNYTLNFGSFTTADFTGATTINILAGTNSATVIVTLIDDILNEGDEELKIKFGTIPAGFNRLNDNIIIRVIDNDFTIDPWGTPLNPTYGIVTSTAPAGYYNSLNGLSGIALKQALQNIIADPLVVRKHTYGDAIDILKEADHNPENGNQVWLMYVETPRAKLDFQTTGSGTGKWNREHIYPQSRGGFSGGTTDTAYGINVWTSTNANDNLCGHSDAHALRAEDGPENSTRNNKDYGGSDYNGPSGTANSWRGDVSRAAFYMAVRYNGLQVVSGNPNDNTVGQLGNSDSMLSWNVSDPRDDFEMNRNNYIYTWQYNRNPFIDMPTLANYIWGSQVGQVWNGTTETKNLTKSDFYLYPNPTNSYFYIKGLVEDANIQIINTTGQVLINKNCINNFKFQYKLPCGMYIVKVTTSNKIAYKKLIIE
jgi:hypothetical protein